MKFYSMLFGSDWEAMGHAPYQHWHQPHYDSLAEQVMANRNEVTTLHNEVQRLSHDLAQSMVLNRALVKLLLSQGVSSPELLEATLRNALAESYPPIDPSTRPSRFCEECGRPLTHLGQKCPYCREISLPEAAAEPEPPLETEPEVVATAAPDMEAVEEPPAEDEPGGDEPSEDDLQESGEEVAEEPEDKPAKPKKSKKKSKKSAD